MALSTNSILDPLAMEKYLEGIQFPISQDDIIQLVISHQAPQEIIEQLNEMLMSDTFYTSDQLYNEIAGIYNDGEAVSMDSEDFERGV